MKPEQPKHHLTILFPPTTKDKKDNTPKTEYGLANKINKTKHKYQK
jgi:hypothetical protein